MCHILLPKGNKCTAVAMGRGLIRKLPFSPIMQLMVLRCRSYPLTTRQPMHCCTSLGVDNEGTDCEAAPRVMEVPKLIVPQSNAFLDQVGFVIVEICLKSSLALVCCCIGPFHPLAADICSNIQMGFRASCFQLVSFQNRPQPTWDESHLDAVQIGTRSSHSP